ncbi:MAG: hypothetical protein DRH90_17020 [Deltaproteobacteria bacterium]|nr:MAG: hypothetical protein DRH90_17020 [Deltaproteobacteria bacterium]
MKLDKQFFGRLYITPTVKYLKVVIPAEAGIQKNTGCPRLTTCRGRLIKSGMTEFGYLLAGLICQQIN